MGKLACEKHGAHAGMLCCDHLRTGAHEGAKSLAFRTLCIDWLGDGSEMGEVLVCDLCAQHFGLSALQRIDGAALEDEAKFPHVSPTCAQCFAACQAQGLESRNAAT